MSKTQHKKTKISTEHLATLNHWRNELLALEKTRYSKDLEKERICRNMINKCLDDVIAYNKNSKENIKT